jgi:hypothetical protein
LQLYSALKARVVGVSTSDNRLDRLEDIALVSRRVGRQLAMSKVLKVSKKRLLLGRTASAMIAMDDAVAEEDLQQEGNQGRRSYSITSRWLT